MPYTTDDKVLGIDINHYTKVCYVLILIASGFGLLANLASLVGIFIPGGILTGLFGFIGIVLVVLGLFVFKDKFSALDLSHFKYIGLLFIAFLVIYFVLVPALLGMGLIGMMVVVLLSAAQFILFFAGFRTYKTGIEATKASITANLKSGLKN